MLRTTNKEVKAKLNAHILSYFDQDHYGSDNPDATPLDNLKEQLEVIDHFPSVYAAGHYLAEGGTFLVYYAEQRDFLGELLEANDFEWHDKYSNDQVFKTYCHLIGRQIAELVKEPKKYPRYYSDKKQTVETQAEIDGSTGVYQVRLVRYYLEHDTERTDWRGKFDTYQEAHEFAMWWTKHQSGAIFKEIK